MFTRSVMVSRRLAVKLFPLALVFGFFEFASIANAADVENSLALFDPTAISDRPSHSAIASGKISINAAIAAGKRLFQTKFNQLDGAGRPASTGDSKPTSRMPIVGNAQFNRSAGLDANSCAGCHNEPSVGGSGEFVANVFVGAHFSDPPTASIAIDVTNERNTTSVFGAGLVELIAREISTDLKRMRDTGIAKALSEQKDVTVDLATKGIAFGSILIRADSSIDFAGLKGVDYDLTLRPFGIRGVAASLREFTIAALNQHHGIQAVERFGWERTGTRDFDQDGIEDEFSLGQVTAVVMFQAALPPPKPGWTNRVSRDSTARRGFQLFQDIGCHDCHRPLVKITHQAFSEPGEFNRPGALSKRDTKEIISWPIPKHYMVRVNGENYVAMFSDLRRHVMCDQEVKVLCNETKKQDNVPLDQFVTSRLWNLSSSAPYCHRGDCLTVTEAIVAHGGEARPSRDFFMALDTAEKKLLIKFLLTLGE